MKDKRDKLGRFAKGCKINKGRIFTPEHRANMSKAKKGKPLGSPSAEHRQHLSEALKGKSNGIRRSPKTEFKKGMTPWNKGTKGVVKAWNKGISPSPETRKKISDNQRGKRSHHWKGGQVVMQGYVYLYKPHHPRAIKKGYVKRCNLIMENHIGRVLHKKELVHHINGIKTDDRISNLRLFHNQSEHAKYHHLNRRGVYGGVASARRQEYGQYCKSFEHYQSPHFI